MPDRRPARSEAAQSVHGAQDEQPAEEDAAPEDQSEQVGVTPDAPGRERDEHDREDRLGCDARIGPRLEQLLHGSFPIVVDPRNA